VARCHSGCRLQILLISSSHLGTGRPHSQSHHTAAAAGRIAAPRIAIAWRPALIVASTALLCHPVVGSSSHICMTMSRIARIFQHPALVSQTGQRYPRQERFGIASRSDAVDVHRARWRADADSRCSPRLDAVLLLSAPLRPVSVHHSSLLCRVTCLNGDEAGDVYAQHASVCLPVCLSLPCRLLSRQREGSSVASDGHQAAEPHGGEGC
jgi:hypothetical protein